MKSSFCYQHRPTAPTTMTNNSLQVQRVPGAQAITKKKPFSNSNSIAPEGKTVPFTPPVHNHQNGKARQNYDEQNGLNIGNRTAKMANQDPTTLSAAKRKHGLTLPHRPTKQGNK